MTIEECKEELKAYIYDKTFIEERMQDIEERKVLLEKITATITDTPGATSIVQDKVAEGIANIMDLTADLEKLIEELKEKQIKIENKIDKLEQPYKNILYMMYIKGNSLVTVASNMNYSYVHMCREHGNALRKYSEL